MNRLGNIICDSSELKKLIAENPDLPIVFLVDSEVVADCDYSSWYCSSINCYVGEVLDCDFSDEKIYSDRSDFEEDLASHIDCNLDDYCPYRKGCNDRCSECYVEFTDEKMDEILKGELKKYEPYWTDCIIIHGTN